MFGFVRTLGFFQFGFIVLALLTFGTTDATAHDDAMADDMIVCPITGELMSADAHANFNGGKVYFCCRGCATTFETNPQIFADGANYQLAITGQAQQTADPLTGEPLRNRRYKVDVKGVPVQVATRANQQRLLRESPDERVALVFGRAGFERGFEVRPENARLRFGDSALELASSDGSQVVQSSSKPRWIWWWLLPAFLGAIVFAIRQQSENGKSKHTSSRQRV